MRDDDADAIACFSIVHADSAEKTTAD